MRLRLSNAFGATALPVSGVAVALSADGRAGSADVEPGTSREVTFSGRPGVTVPPGAQVLSDPVDVDVAPLSVLSVTTYLAQGQAGAALTSHPGSRTTSHLVRGSHLHGTQLHGTQLHGTTPVEHWYLLAGVEVWSADPAAAVVLLGDSLTDGRGSTTDGNDRWPDQMLDRWRASRAGAGIAVVNHGIGGNRVLDDGLGPGALARLDRDVLAQTGVRWLVLFEGVNDIGCTPATAAAQEALVSDLTAGYAQIVARAHARGIRVYGATLLPFGGHGDYDDPDGHREASRQAVNAWIRGSGRLDGVLDFDRVTRDPARPSHLLPGIDDGDRLHLSPSGYALLAAAVPPELFTE